MANLGLTARGEAWLELIQLFTGIVLLGYICAHICLISTVQISPETMNSADGILEALYITTWGSAGVVVVFILHGILTVRKVPASFGEFRAMRARSITLRHADTYVWWVQVTTAVVVVILGGIHLWVSLWDMPVHAAKSAKRIFEGYHWFYPPLIHAVVVHANAGFYRIMIKWGWMPRTASKWVAWLLTFFYVVLGMITIVVLYRLGGTGVH